MRGTNIPVRGNYYDYWYSKMVNSAKGFGFIEPEDGSNDAFVHISAVERAGLTTLNEGQKVTYEVQPGKNGKSSAENLSVTE